MKELIRKVEFKSWNLPRKITVNEDDIFDERKIANKYNAFCIHIESKLTSKIPIALSTFESYMSKPDYMMERKQLLINELKNAFFSLKINKSLGFMTLVLMFLKNVLTVYVNL